MNSEYQDQVSQPIIFKRGTTLVAPVLLWLMDALPAVLAGVMFYPLTRIYDVEFDKEFLVLSILAATFTLAMWPPRNPTRQIISGRRACDQPAVALVCVGGRFTGARLRHEIFRRLLTSRCRYLGAWTPVPWSWSRWCSRSDPRAATRDAAPARRAVIVGCTQVSMELSAPGLHVESVFRWPASLMIVAATGSAVPSRAASVRFDDVAAFEPPQHRRHLHRHSAGAGGAHARPRARTR
jgi:hypothetical protein